MLYDKDRCGNAFFNNGLKVNLKQEAKNISSTLKLLVNVADVHN